MKYSAFFREIRKKVGGS